MYGLNSDEYYTNYIAELERELSRMAADNMSFLSQIKSLKRKRSEDKSHIYVLKDRLKKTAHSLNIISTELSISRRNIEALKVERDALKERVEILDID